VAGAILVLVTIRDGSDDALLEQAVSLGDRLLADAEIDARGWRWRSPAAPRALPLTGFSHGASGIGHALLALFAATGEARFREAALGAFAWERSWFDGDAGNWPDFRDVAPSALRLGTALPNAVAWCHGAPGILLSRLYAAKLLDDERLRVEARTAAMTTQRSLTAMAADPLASLGLCHGLAGNALILMRAATELADDTLGKHAQDALATLWERDLLSQLALEPTLMTGLSGLILACLSGDGLPISDVLSGVPPTE
jgi:lantibiotic modifying enzyme